MKISILLPYKENFSPTYAGAVSIFINDTIKISKFKNETIIYGNTKEKKKFIKNYVNLNFEKSFLKSSTKSYILEFLKKEKERNSDIIEVHNRPSYLKYLADLKYTKKVLYFHNDPLEMNGSKHKNERIYLLEKLDKIIFNSEWSKTRFVKNLPKNHIQSSKLQVIKQSIDPKKVNLKNKKNIITFVGKLNSAKGYDIFGNALIPILEEFKNWSAIVIGDEPREKINFEHPRFKILGFQEHKKVLQYLEKTSIAVVCSRWNEPFGRSSLEAASRGCAVIISDRGGLKETITDGIILKNIMANNFTRNIKKLILNPKLLFKFQSNSLKNFFLTNKFVSRQIDQYRSLLKADDNLSFKISKLKILHITNLNEKHNGRLFYNTGRRINNGLIKTNHKILTLSDRDLLKSFKSFNDINGSNKFNKMVITTVRNFKPNIIILGHADSIKKESLSMIKKEFPKIKISQWFLDRMDGEWINNRYRFLDKIDYMDHSFCTTDPKSLNFKKRYKISFIPNPVDEALDDLEVYNNKNPEYDLFFAMSHGVHRGKLKKGKFDEREIFVNKLIKKNPNLKFNIFGMNNIQPIWGDEFRKKLYNSKVALNLSQGRPLKYYSSDRIAQLMGNGIATFIDKKTKLNKFLPSDSAIFYNSIDDLNIKLNQLIKNTKLRNRIAKKGKLIYHAKFNSLKIAEFVIYKTLNLKNKFNWK